MQVAHCFALWHWSALSLAAVLMGSIPSLIISFFCHIFTDVAPVSEVPCLAPILWRRCHTCTSGTLAQMVSKGWGGWVELRNQLEPKLALVLSPTLHPRGQTSLVSQHCTLLKPPFWGLQALPSLAPLPVRHLPQSQGTTRLTLRLPWTPPSSDGGRKPCGQSGCGIQVTESLLTDAIKSTATKFVSCAVSSWKQTTSNLQITCTFFTTQRNFDATVSQDCQAVSDMCLWMQIVFPSDVASGSAICISMRWR